MLGLEVGGLGLVDVKYSEFSDLKTMLCFMVKILP